MALDTLDYTVMVGLALAVLAYFGKEYIWPLDDGTSAGFVASAPGGGTSRSIVETLKSTKKNVVVFYGTQTGTAEDYASKLSKELSSNFGLKTMTADVADYDFEDFDKISSDALCFFLMATYGEGEPTDNAIDFVNYLDNEADTLSTLRFSVFGLGNSTYEFFNAIGKKVDQKLEELGAERFAEYSQGDDGLGTMDEDFLAWKDAVFESLENNLGFERTEAHYEPSLKLVENPSLTKDDPSVSQGEPSKAYVKSASIEGPYDHQNPYISKITKTRELFSSSTRSCVHAEFDLSASNMKYSTGDHLAVWPSNCDENVAKFLKAFGLEHKLETVFDLKVLDSTARFHFHTPITYGAVIRHHLEISGPISRQFLSSIAGLAPTEEAKETAKNWGSNKASFAKEIHEKSFNIADALLHISGGAPWTDVPFEFLIELIGHLQPRYYSISSSSASEKQLIHITAVVENEKKGDVLVSGVATNLLKHIEIDQNKSSEKPFVHYDLEGPRGKFSKHKLPVHVRRSTFKLPNSPSVPVILIGPGTGIAPFRGFVRERVTQKKNQDVKIGKTLVYYGCRNENEDFLYKEEWPQYAQVLGDSFEMHTAFSRKDPDAKVYVQHQLAENGKEINRLLEQEKAYIYVCGDALKMARDVQKALTKVIAEERGVSDERAAELIRSLKTQNRYQEDVW